MKWFGNIEIRPEHVVWQEDDSDINAEGHEGLEQAWKRVYNEDRRSNSPLATQDGGDMKAILYSRGRVAICSYPGNDAIYVVPELAEAVDRGTKLITEFITGFYAFAAYVHSWAEHKGFWEKGVDRNDGEMIALMHSELSEALEFMRHGNPPSDHIPEFTGVEEEIADLIIRIMDTSQARGWRVAEAIVAKMAFNETRPHKHGKKF